MSTPTYEEAMKALLDDACKQFQSALNGAEKVEAYGRIEKKGKTLYIKIHTEDMIANAYRALDAEKPRGLTR